MKKSGENGRNLVILNENERAVLSDIERFWAIFTNY